MRVDLAVFCFDVTISETGRVSVHDILQSTRLQGPTDLSGVKYVAMINFEPHESDDPRVLSLHVVGPDGELAGEAGSVECRPVVNPFDGWSYATASFELTVRLYSPGIYIAVLGVDDVVVQETRLQISMDNPPR